MLKAKSFHFLFLLSLFALLLNLFSPLVFAFSVLAIESPSQTYQDLTLTYDAGNHNFGIQLPDNNQASSYQLTYRHLVDNQPVTEGVQGVLESANNQETATVFLGTQSAGQPNPHTNIIGGTVTISPENIQRSFAITGNRLWYLDDNGNDLSPADPIELNVWYTIPGSDNIQIRFTQLPAGSHHFQLHRLDLTLEQQRTLGAFTNYVYDFTSDMANGTFRFDLTFPLPEGIHDLHDIDFSYLESLAEVNNPHQIELEKLHVANGQVTASGIGHMTIFVLTSPDPVNVDCSNATLIIQNGDTCYNTIQAAINAANPGDTIKVGPGTYSESLTIDKPLTLQSTAGASQTTLSSPTSTAIRVQADNVIIDGFTITIPSEDASGKYGILSRDHSNITIRNNLFSHLISSGNDIYAHAYAIAINSNSEDIDQLIITNNIFSNISGDQTSAAIALGWSSIQTRWFNSPLIESNHISDVTSTSKGAYGILINHQTHSPLIQNNIISDLTGQWTHAIGLEGDTSDPQVLRNQISNLVANSPTNVSAGIFIEDNQSALDPSQTFQINHNSFDSMDYGVINTMGLLTNDPLVNATYNWWGANDGPNDPDDVLSNPQTNGGSGVGVWGRVDYSNWLGSSDITPPPAPEIIFPYENDAFSSTPILDDWTDVTDASGIDHYRIEYQYDDGHTFPGAPYRTTTVSQRNHMPTIHEQGGVRFRVQAIDGAGNYGAWSEWRHYYYDATKPNMHIFTPSSNSTLNSSFIVSGSISDSISGVKDIRVRFRRESDNHLVATYWANYNPTTNQWSVNIDPIHDSLPDGDYRIIVRGRDNANNKAWRVRRHVVVDLTAPTINLTNPLSGTITNQPFNILGLATDNLSGLNWLNLYYRLTGNSTWSLISNWSYSGSSSETINYNWTPASDGNYEIMAQAGDMAGNQGESNHLTNLTYDTTPPAKVTGMHIIDHQSNDLGCNGYTNNRHITVDWDDTSASDFAHYDYMIREGNIIDHPTISEKTGNIRDLDGYYKYKVRAVDQVGNEGEWSDWCGVTLDRVAPTVSATINPSSPDGNHGWYRTQPTVTLTASDNLALDHIEYHWDSDAWSTYTSPLQPTEGEHTLHYRAFDKAGNISEEGSLVIKFDQTAPTPPQNLDVVDITSNSAKVIWQAASDNISIDHYTVEWNLQGESYVHNHTVDANTFEWAIDSLNSGLWHVRVLAVDPAGNVTIGYKDFEVGTSTPATTPTPTPTTPPAQVLGLQTQTSSSPSPSPSPSATPSPTPTSQITNGEVKGASAQACSGWAHNLPWLIIFVQFFLSLSLFFTNKSVKRRLLHLSLGLLVTAILWFLAHRQTTCLATVWQYIIPNLIGVVSAIL